MANRALLILQIVEVLNAALDNPGVQQLKREPFLDGEEWKIIITYEMTPSESFCIRIIRRDTLIG